MIKRLGIRAHDLGTLSPKELVSELVRFDLQGVQLAPLKAFEHVKTHEDFIDTQTSDGIMLPFQEHNKDVFLFGCYLNHSHDQVNKLEANSRITKGYIDVARRHKVKLVGTETFTLNENGKPHPLDHTDQGYYAFLKNIEHLVAYAEDNKVFFGIEPAFHHIICDIERTKRLLRDLSSRSVRLIFDPCNLMTPELAKNQKGFFEDYFEAFEAYTDIIHFKDFIYEKGDKVFLTAGHGHLDHQNLKAVANQSKHAFDLILEGVSAHELTKAVEHLKY